MGSSQEDYDIIDSGNLNKKGTATVIIQGKGELWLEGKVSSGKTELAITAGDFFNRKGSWDDRVKHLHSPKTRIKSIERELKKYQNAVFILDDIKKEETVRNRGKRKECNRPDCAFRIYGENRTGRIF